MNIIFDGDDEVLLTDQCIQTELELEDIIKFYGSTLIYYKTAKKFAKEDRSNWVTLRLGRINSGLTSLLNRMIRELGQEKALLVAAKTDLDIELCD